LVIFALLGTQTASAGENGCEKNYAVIVGEAYPQAQRISDSEFTAEGAALFLAKDGAEKGPYSLVCRVWPANPQLLLVAVPFIREMSDMATTGELDVLVLDARTFKVQRRLRLQEAIDDDAFKIRTIAFDTARYQVAPGQMAFGIRIAKKGSSRVNPLDEVSLSLFVMDNEHLRPVLEGIVTDRYAGEWDGNCAGTVVTTKRVLAMGDKGARTYADIWATERTSVTTTMVDGKGECVEHISHNTPHRTPLIFDGERYKVPQAMKPL